MKLSRRLTLEPNLCEFKVIVSHQMEVHFISGILCIVSYDFKVVSFTHWLMGSNGSTYPTVEISCNLRAMILSAKLKQTQSGFSRFYLCRNMFIMFINVKVQRNLSGFEEEAMQAEELSHWAVQHRACSWSRCQNFFPQ